MPYTKGYGTDGSRPLLEYVNKDANGAAAGIVIPQYASSYALRRSVQAIYVSGVNTLTAEGWEELTVNGETLTADEDGLITFTWDFASDLDTDVDHLSPADYARSVMIWGDTWYVINGGALHYGSARGSTPEEMAEIGTVFGIGAPVHLWQGKVLTADGMVYSLSGGTASGGTAVGDSGKQVSSVPIYQSGGTQVYYGFTRVDGERVDGYRVFRMNGAGPRFVTMEEDAVYDGIVLNSTGSIILNGDGKLVNSMSLDLAGAYPDGINQISNSFGYDGSALLLRYDGGGVRGIDYVNGFEFFSTKPQSTTAAFTGYVRTAVKNLLSPIFGSGQDGLVGPEPSLVESEQLQNTLGNREPGTAMGTGGNDGIPDDLETSGKDDGTEPDTGGGIDGDVAGGPGDGPAEEPDTGESGSEDGESEAEGESAADGAGGDGTAGSAAVDGQLQDTGDVPEAGGSGGPDSQSGGPNGEAGELSGEAGELSDKAGEPSGEAGELSGEAGELTGETGELSGEAGELTGETGELSGEVGELSGETGELSGKAGELSGIEKAANERAESSEISSNEEANPKVDGESNREKTPEEQLVKLFGDSVVLYSEKTGRYELFATETMLSDEPVGYEEMLARRAGEKNGTYGGENAAQEEDQKSHFAVTGWGLGRSLDLAEKQGFALLVVASSIAFVGLAVLYTVIRRRKK